MNECTNYVGKRPTGAPTVHIVVSTLTHTTSSIIATRPGNFGGAVPVPSSKRTTKTSAQVTSDISTEIKSSVTHPQTMATTAQEQTSNDVERTSAMSSLQISATNAPGTTVQQASPTTSQQIASTAPQQVPSTGTEQAQTTCVQQPTSKPSSAAEQTDSPSAAQPIGTGNDGESTSGASAIYDTVPSPSATTVAAGSEDGNQVSFTTTVPTNGQLVTSAGYAESQQTATTTANRGLEPSIISKGTDATQVPSAGAVQSNEPAKSSSGSGTTIVAVAPVLTIGSTTITANPSSEYIINSQTLAPGGPAITIGGTTYSLMPSASAIIENGQIQSLVPTFSVSGVPQTTLGSSVITANPTGGFVYVSQTFSAGGSAVTADGNTYSLATSEGTTYIVEDGVTQQPATYQTAGPVLTFGSSIVTANSEPVIILGSQTLQAGGSEVVVGQTTYSLATSGSSTFVVQNGITSALAAPQGSPVIASSAEVHVTANALSPKVTMDTGAVTQNTASEYMVAGQTLTAGGSAVEVEGTTYSIPSLPSSASRASSEVPVVVVNGKTSTLPVTKGTGAAVLSGLQRTSASQLSGSRVTGSATTTSSTQELGSTDRTQSVASTSTAGAERLVQKSAGDTVVALIVGVVGMVVF